MPVQSEPTEPAANDRPSPLSVEKVCRKCGKRTEQNVVKITFSDAGTIKVIRFDAQCVECSTPSMEMVYAHK